MSYVLEGLYIGGVDDACNVDKLQDQGITHILTVNNKPLDQKLTEDFQYKFVHALDMESYDLLSHFMDSIEFIEDARRKQGAVLVHCWYGESRSATLVLAYLMHKMDLSLDDALTLLLKERPQIRPNPGFKEQLQLFGDMGNNIDPTNTTYKRYKLNNLAVRMKTVNLQTQSLPEEMYSVDPLTHGTAGHGQLLYKCKKCRRPLFTQSSVLLHKQGSGEAAFTWRSEPHLLDDREQEDCHQSLFIEPVKWMANDILQTEGKLSCPKCNAKLGSFNWAGSRCCCGAWNTPAFHILISKVDASRPNPQSTNPNLYKPATTSGCSASTITPGCSTDDKLQSTQTSSSHRSNVLTMDSSQLDLPRLDVLPPLT